MNGLEIYEYKETGFRPVMIFQNWRIALTNYGEKQSISAITSISRHLETDEAFVLLKGSCTLFIGGTGKSIDSIDVVYMEPLRIYNITKGTWHARALTPDSTVLIVENQDTGAHNSEEFSLTQKQIKLIRKEYSLQNSGGNSEHNL